MNPYKSSGGGGAAYISQLDVPVKTIMSDYVMNRYDYYIGCQHTTPITIGLPQSYNGRLIVIKDETGFADLVPIYVHGNIDGEVRTITMASKHMSLGFVYNNGWRII